MEEEFNVIVVSAELSNPIKDMDGLRSKDVALVETIIEYAERVLIPNNIEIFEKYDNIFVTEAGYYFTVYEKDLKITDNE